jgi:polysaccharide pyruvyl transferase WcaK-like protein
MQQSRVARTVAIVGPYILHNFGDDLIGAVLAKTLKDRFDAQVLLPYLEDGNRQWLDIPLVPTNRKAIFQSHSVLIGGGGMLGDAGRSPNNRYLKSAAKAALFSRCRGKPVLVSAVGAGPLALRSSRLLCKAVCRFSQVIGVRDQRSENFLIKELGVPSEKVVRGADVALLWPKVFDIQPLQTDSIGVQFDVNGYVSAEQNPLLKDIIGSLVNFCRSYDHETILVSNFKSVTQLGRHFVLSPRSLQYRTLPSFLSQLAGLRAIVTSHLHLAIAAYAAQVPCFSIYVNEKTKRFYDQIGHPERALDIATTTPGEVDSLLKSVMDAKWAEEDDVRLDTLQNDSEKLIDIFSLLV